MELLTGKCKEDFEKWYSKYIKSKENRHKLISGTYIDYFYLLTDSMQYGVLVDFFYSVNLVFVITYKKRLNQFRVSYYMDGTKFVLVGIPNWFLDRKEARQKAIKKANELYNLNNK